MNWYYRRHMAVLVESRNSAKMQLPDEVSSDWSVRIYESLMEIVLAYRKIQ